MQANLRVVIDFEPSETGMLKHKILILDDHLLFADGLELMLSDINADIEVVRCTKVSTTSSSLAQLEQHDLAIVDLHLPELDGFSFLRMLRKNNVHLKTVIVSGTDSQAEIERAIGLGASGFISKDSSKQEMLLGIQSVLNGRRFISQKWAGRISWPLRGEDSTSSAMDKVGPRQLDVLKMMADGLQNKQIAAVLGISVSAVKSHIKILFNALNVKNRSACVKEGIQKNLI